MSSLNNAVRKEEEQRIQRAAEREGRRTRRRRGKDEMILLILETDASSHLYFVDRERKETLNNHLDGMSSDDEVPDHEVTIYKNQMSKKNSDRFHWNETYIMN